MDCFNSDISNLKLDKFNINSIHLCQRVPRNSNSSGGFMNKSSCNASDHRIHQTEASAHAFTPNIQLWKSHSIAEQAHSTVAFYPPSAAVSLPPSLSGPPVSHTHSGIYSPLCPPWTPSALWPLCHFQYIDTSAQTSNQEHRDLL